MRKDPIDKLARGDAAAAAAAVREPPPLPRPKRELPPIVEAVEVAPTPSPTHRAPRDTRRWGCAGCSREGRCDLAAPGQPCPLERDAFAELRSPERLPKLLRDAIAAEFRTYFRAKRAEAERGDKIDGEASKMLQGLLKAVETYLDLLARVEAAPSTQASAPVELYPSLAAVLAASGGSLFSEVPDPALRERLRRTYVQTVEREDAIIRDALAAAGAAHDRGA